METKQPQTFASPIPGSPPTPEEIGRSGWTILHTTAAAFPNHPSLEDKQHLKDFIESWSHVYPCSHCAYHMRRWMERHPPSVESKREVSTYICVLHNQVNRVLKKPIYDCNADVVLKRWHPTYPDIDDPLPLEEQISQAQKELRSRNTHASRWSFLQPQPGANTVTPIDESQLRPEVILSKLKACKAFCPEKKI